MKSLRYLLFFLCSVVYSQTVSLSLQQADLAATLRFLAHKLKQNVVISPDIQGVVNIELIKQNPTQIMNLLLKSYGLASIQIANTRYIAPYTELLTRQQAATAWEMAQPVVTYYWRIQYAKAKDIAAILDNKQNHFLSKRGYVQVDPRTNLLLVQDIPASAPKLKQLIRKLDTPSQQISIAAKLVSIDKDSEQALGLRFNPAVRENSLHVAIIKLASHSLLDVTLQALENQGHAELISSPRLFTANQQMASIEAGEEIPYQEMSDSGGTTTSFKKAVLALHVTPQLLPGNKVLLQLKINQDRPNSRLVHDVPAISTRQISTSVMVKAGQTLVLGGIYETDKARFEDGLPYISQVPVVGWLFKQQRTRAVKRELLIFVTPTITN